MANYSNHSNYFKPDSALKRSEELINVGQKLEALQVLREVVTARRFRAWQKSHETILFKYVELCVDLKKGWIAKDGLIQYRNSCQIVNISSLEDVIKHFLHLATERTELARSKAQSLEEALDVDDLEADARPEDLMLSSVTSEKGKDRSDRELVTPSFKFLWETYKTVLEVLKNNSKLETLYAMTAHRAFQFCKQYKRTREFHRLCDTIRYHLTNLNKFRDQRDRPDLSAPESLQLYLDTRFEQLKIATELELWQEAFRSVEDIHGLMCMVKKTPKPALMVIYYSKLTEIFRVSSSHLHHAYAWLKLFSMQKSYNKNLSQKAMQLIASSVVLAALSVPPYDHTYGLSHLELENEKERNLKIFNLIGFHLEPKVEGKEVLSRSSLLSELVSKGVINCATPEVKDLYNLLENYFSPLDFASKVQPLLTKISKTEGKLSLASSLPEVQLSQYIPSLEKTATLKLLLQVSHSYKTMKIESLSRMIPFFDFSVVEKISVDAVKHNFISLKVDHTRGAILFGNLGLASAGLQDHVAAFSESLNSVRSMIYSATEKGSKLESMLMDLHETVNKEHKRVLARKSIIEKRKEAQECHLLEMEREEVSKRLKLQKITEEAEKKRLASEYEERKNQRIRREIEQRELEEAQALLQEAEKRSKKKGKKPIIEAEKVTKQTLMDLALSEQLRERQESEKKLQKLAKTMDHLERAKREEAAPLIEAAFQRRLVEEKMLHELEQQQETTLSRQCHDGDLREKNRLSRMLEDKMIFQERVISRRQEEYNRLKIEREERMQQIIHQRKQERETKRKLLFHARMEEENRKKIEEEEEARRREVAEKRKREEAEHRAKLDEIAKKQRQRELELEEKEKIRREGLLGRSSEVPSRTSVLPPAGGIPLESGMPAAATVVAVAGAAAPPDGPAAAPPEKYVPKHKRAGDRQPAAPADSDRWGGRRDDHPTAFSDRRRSNDSRTAFGGGVGSRPSTYSSRYNSRG